MSRNKLVSICMPNFNTPKDYLETSISSVAGQQRIELGDIELVIVDDYSDTDSRKALMGVVDRQRKRSPRLNIQVHSNRYEKGPGNARNIGIEKSNGEYIAFLDSDDALVEHAIEKSLQKLGESTDFSMVFSDLRKFDETLKKAIHERKRGMIYRLHREHKGTLQDPIFHGSFGEHFSVYTCQALEAVGGYRNMRYSEVYDIQVRICGLSPHVNFGHTPEFLYLYRDNPNGLTSDYARIATIREREGPTEQMLLENIRTQYPNVTRVSYVDRPDNPHGPFFFDIYIDGSRVEVPWFDRETLSINTHEMIT